MIAVAARLDENGVLWLLMPDKITQNRSWAKSFGIFWDGFSFGSKPPVFPVRRPWTRNK